jgi:uncharacterized protein with PIN domain
MTAIKIYLDEDVHAFVAQALRLRGYEATTTAAEGRLGAEDTGQLDFATTRGYAILSYDQRDFPRLHYERMRQGGEHGGILIGIKRDPRRTLRGLLRLLSDVSAEEVKNRLEYLSNWA